MYISTPIGPARLTPCLEMLKEFQMKMESLQQRREELERKEFQLKESLLKFDKFLKVEYTNWGGVMLKNLYSFLHIVQILHSYVRTRAVTNMIVYELRKMIRRGPELWKRHLKNVKWNVERTGRLAGDIIKLGSLQGTKKFCKFCMAFIQENVTFCCHSRFSWRRRSVFQIERGNCKLGQGPR